MNNYIPNASDLDPENGAECGEPETKEEKMLDMETLAAVPLGTVFATGEAVDGPDGLYMSRSGKTLRWVALRRHGPNDWCIYCHFSDKDAAWIKRHGDKVHGEGHIRKLVPCTDEVLAHYAH